MAASVKFLQPYRTLFKKTCQTVFVTPIKMEHSSDTFPNSY